MMPQKTGAGILLSVLVSDRTLSTALAVILHAISNALVEIDLDLDLNPFRFLNFERFVE